MGIMDEAVQDGIGVSWIGNELVPALDGKLAGDDSGFAVMAVVEDFEEVAAHRAIERLKSKIVEDK